MFANLTLIQGIRKKILVVNFDSICVSNIDQIDYRPFDSCYCYSNSVQLEILDRNFPSDILYRMRRDDQLMNLTQRQRWPRIEFMMTTDKLRCNSRTSKQELRRHFSLMDECSIRNQLDINYCYIFFFSPTKSNVSSFVFALIVNAFSFLLCFVVIVAMNSEKKKRACMSVDGSQANHNSAK